MERPIGLQSGWLCEAEAEAVAQWVHRLLLSGMGNGSIGVVTFFACQRTLIQKKLEKKLSQQKPVGDWPNPIVATAHGFQGGERDVICLSLCYRKDEKEGSHAFLKKNLNLLNVAVSRARALCVVFGNGAAAECSPLKEIRGLWRCSRGWAELGDGKESPFESPWEEKLFHALLRRGVETTPQYATCGRRLDLAYLGNGLQLDIEVDGATYHAVSEGVHCPEDLWRNHILETAGWQVLRFWVSELRRDMDGCVDKVLETIATWKRKK
jgi:very-short-patch-repair endonuclease